MAWWVSERRGHVTGSVTKTRTLPLAVKQKKIEHYRSVIESADEMLTRLGAARTR